MARQNKGPWLDLNRYGVYCVRWTEPPTVKGGRSNSREKSCETTDYKEATVKFAEFLLEGEQARLEELRKARAINKPTCAELFDHYRELYLYNPLAKVAAPEQQEYYLALLGEFFGPMKSIAACGARPSACRTASATPTISARAAQRRPAPCGGNLLAGSSRRSTCARRRRRTPGSRLKTFRSSSRRKTPTPATCG
jgi:hypothetical protein